MNTKDIIRMAIEAGWDSHQSTFDTRIKAFADLVASAAQAKEREACAELLEEAAEATKFVDPQGFVWKAVKGSADAIRARGNT